MAPVFALHRPFFCDNVITVRRQAVPTGETGDCVMKNSKNMKGILLLLLTALVWGMAFVAQSKAADAMGHFTYVAARNVLAILFLMVLLGLRAVFRRRGGEASPEKKVPLKRVLTAGFLVGLCLFGGSNLQQAGIGSYPDGAAAAGRAGFLTATYVVMVAAAAFFTGKKLYPLIFAAVAVCIGGMYLLCLSGGISGIYIGDGLVLLSALCFTGQIMFIDRFSDVDGLVLSCLEFIVTFILSFIGALLFEAPSLSQIRAGLLPILYAGLVSSGIGYTLQILGQKYTDPASASIAMSMESVFAALAGWLLLHERLSPVELLGCFLVFSAVILAQVPDFLGKKA